jgi:outer membrane protein W
MRTKIKGNADLEPMLADQASKNLDVALDPFVTSIGDEK